MAMRAGAGDRGIGEGETMKPITLAWLMAELEREMDESERDAKQRQDDAERWWQNDDD